MTLPNWMYRNDMISKFTISNNTKHKDVADKLNHKFVTVWLGQMGVAQAM